MCINISLLVCLRDSARRIIRPTSSTRTLSLYIGNRVKSASNSENFRGQRKLFAESCIRRGKNSGWIWVTVGGVTISSIIEVAPSPSLQVCYEKGLIRTGNFYLTFFTTKIIIRCLLLIPQLSIRPHWTGFLLSPSLYFLATSISPLYLMSSVVCVLQLHMLNGASAWETVPKLTASCLTMWRDPFWC